MRRLPIAGCPILSPLLRKGGNKNLWTDMILFDQGANCPNASLPPFALKHRAEDGTRQTVLNLCKPALGPPALCKTPAMRESEAGLSKSLCCIRRFSGLGRCRGFQLSQRFIHARLEVTLVVVLPSAIVRHHVHLTACTLRY